MKLDVKELIKKLTNTPMVVAEGTSGNWFYRKWSDGKIEAWYTATFNSAFNNGNYFGGYRGTSQTINLPSLSQTAVKFVSATASTPNTGFCIVGSVSTSQLVIWPYNRTQQTSTQNNIPLYIYVVMA